MITTALQITGLNKNFGALQVASDINFTLQQGARHALIGPNGAGKTTFVNLVTGALAPSSGKIFLVGKDITGLGQAQRSQSGLVRTFQINQLFPNLTVLENIALAVAEKQSDKSSLWRPLASSRRVIDEAIELLATLKLQDEALKPVQELAYGQQRLIEIALALALKPKVLILDEPVAGVSAAETSVILEVLGELDQTISVLIIEHDMDVVFQFAEYITVLVGGRILAEGTVKEIAANEQVRAVYLGEEYGRTA